VKAWEIGGGWKRVKRGKGFSYSHNGKFTSAQKFNRAFKRRSVKRVEEKSKDTERIRRALKLPELQPQKHGYKLCNVADRKAFYEQVKEDRRTLAGKISEEEHSAIRVVIDIDPRSFKRKKKFKRGSIEFKQRGHRTFRDLGKLRNFLGLNYKYGEEGLAYPDWSRRGICKFEKRAYLTTRKLRGERIIGEKTLRRYVIKNFMA